MPLAVHGATVDSDVIVGASDECERTRALRAIERQRFSGHSAHPFSDEGAGGVEPVNGNASSRWTVNWAGQRLHRQTAIRSSTVATRTSGD
jgi:hypothetical protein